MYAAVRLTRRCALLVPRPCGGTEAFAGTAVTATMPRKRVTQEVLDGLPTVGPGQQVVRIVQVRARHPRCSSVVGMCSSPCYRCERTLCVQAKGNHLYEVTLPDGTSTLCRMPPKFRNLVWIKRGMDASDV